MIVMEILNKPGDETLTKYGRLNEALGIMRLLSLKIS